MKNKIVVVIITLILIFSFVGCASVELQHMDNAQLVFAQCKTNTDLIQHEAIGYISNEELDEFENGTLNTNVKFYNPTDITKYVIVKPEDIDSIKTVSEDEMIKEIIRFKNSE